MESRELCWGVRGGECQTAVLGESFLILGTQRPEMLLLPSCRLLRDHRSVGPFKLAPCIHVIITEP